MQKKWAAAGSSLFFGLAPGMVAGVVPWKLTRWQTRPVPGGWPIRALGAALTAVSAPVLVAAFVRFVTEGLGTPAPVAPPEHLVVGGPYRHVRNPMYVAVLSAIGGQALLLGQPVLVVYGATGAIVVVTFVHLYEEPILRRKFGAEYDQYLLHVPRWRPTLRPWPGASAGPSTADPGTAVASPG